MIKSLNKNIIDVKTFGLAVKTVKSYGKTVWERVKPTPVEFGGLKFTALEAGEIGMTHNGTNATTTKPNFSYSKDGVNWTEWDYTNITVVEGDKVYLKGVNDRISRSSSNYSQFTSTGKIAGSGNIMSLLYGDDYEGKISLSGKNYCFYKLFEGCTSLVTAPELQATTLAGSCYYDMFYNCTSLTTAPALPATKLAGYCYGSMFYNCNSLTSSPELPANKLEYGCYDSMFNGCSSLNTAPELQATTLAGNCYYHMFKGCTSLVTAPALPATTLANSCYDSMFEGCTSLTSAPELPATTLESNCYYCMFRNCSKLNYVKANFTTTPSNTYTQLWLSGVSSTGTFVPNPDATWTDTITRGTSTVPEGWTIQK